MTSSPAANERLIDPTDWTTLCQSEWAAMAADRELAEGLAMAAQLWNLALGVDRSDTARSASADAARSASAHAARSASADAQTGAAASGAAPHDGGSAAGDLAELRRRLADLERRAAS